MQNDEVPYRHPLPDDMYVPNTSIIGRIVFPGTEIGIPNLTVAAIDFDPFFNTDDVLKVVKTNEEGRFELSYAPSDYSIWDTDYDPDIVVQILGPRYTDPKLFGNRLLYETKEEKDFDEGTLMLGDIPIHSDNIDGWLVTHTTLNPETASPVALFHGNEIHHLVDGDSMFLAVTDAAMGAQKSINLMTLFFDVDNHLITKFRSTFKPHNPPATLCKVFAMEATLEEELLKKTLSTSNKLVNVIVTDIPLSANDTMTEVLEFFENTGVNVNAFTKGLAVLHSKAIIVDGDRAILMGSPLKQGYFNDERHAIRDARHKGRLIHDVSLDIAGPAVARIDETFEAVWRSTGKSPEMITPVSIDERVGDNIASVQVLRTLPGGTFEGLPHGETGILEAYERAIYNAERYIYIENQYLMSPEIIGALIGRMKDTPRNKLQIILVLNFKPDLPGYPDQQIDNVNLLKAVAEEHEHQLGVFTMWTRNVIVDSDGNEIVDSDGKTHFEIMPIYVHSKVAIIDDKWATVGSANLDGTSMNYHQIGLIAGGAIFDNLTDMIKLGDPAKFVWDLYWHLFFYVLKEFIFNAKILLAILYFAFKLATDFKDTTDAIRESIGDILDIWELVGELFTRQAAHAVPNRSRQPPRSVELNVVMYNGIAGLDDTPVIGQLRERLWTEHLGLDTLPTDMQDVPAHPAVLNWLQTWTNRAEENQERFINDEKFPGNEPKILPWQPKTDAEEYLRALKIRTNKLRNHAHKFNFENCKVEDKDLLPWPII